MTAVAEALARLQVPADLKAAPRRSGQSKSEANAPRDRLPSLDVAATRCVNRRVAIIRNLLESPMRRKALRNSVTLQEAARGSSGDCGTGRRVRRRQTPGGFDRGNRMAASFSAVGDICMDCTSGVRCGGGTGASRAGSELLRPDRSRRVHHAHNRGASYTSPDIFHGTAGRLRFNLLLWQETGIRSIWLMLLRPESSC